MSECALTIKTALITGGATGIGLTVAKQFATRGPDVVILGHIKEQVEQAVVDISTVTASAEGLVAEVQGELLHWCRLSGG
jgi:short-subunit dehydrogenase involved in D-alanine esterification of teichoic acids